MSFLRTWLIVVAMSGVSIASSLALLPQPAAAQTAEVIVVEGNRRVEAETVRSYFRPGSGGRLDQPAIDEGSRP